MSRLKEVTDDVYAISAISGQGIKDLMRSLKLIVSTDSAEDISRQSREWFP